MMRLSVILISAFVCSLANARPATTAERESCEKPIEARIRQLEDQMRRGYSPAHGEYLNREMQDLKERRARCRTIG